MPYPQAACSRPSSEQQANDPSWRQLDRVRKGAVRIVHPTLDCALGKPGNPHPRLSFLKWHHRAVGDRVPFGRLIRWSRGWQLAEHRAPTLTHPLKLELAQRLALFAGVGFKRADRVCRPGATEAALQLLDPLVFLILFLESLFLLGNCASPGPFAYRIFHPLACVDWHRLLSPRAPVRSPSLFAATPAD